MLQCTHPDCSWRAVAPSQDAARRQYAEHIVGEHARTVDADVPDGMVQVRFGEDDEWITTTRERALELHETVSDH